MPQWHGALTEPPPAAARQELTHLMSAHHTDHENGKQRPSISQHGDSSWDAMRDCTQMFPSGSCCYNPMVVSSEDVAGSETSIEITGGQEPNLGNGQISPAKGKAVGGSTN